MSSDREAMGAPSVRLLLTCDKPQAQLAVRLCHVHPDGASTRITCAPRSPSSRVANGPGIRVEKSSMRSDLNGPGMMRHPLLWRSELVASCACGSQSVRIRLLE